MSGARQIGLLLALLAIAGAIAAVALASAEKSEPDPVAANGSTLIATWVDPDGNGVLERGPGESPTPRTELAPAAPAVSSLATFAQIADAHVRDEESPARASIADRAGQAANSTFRPQETLTPQVLAAAVRSVDAIDPDVVVETGDLIDNAQRNELAQALAILDGGSVDPDSGGPGYAGPQQASSPDPFFYRPDLDPPEHPGLLEAAQEPFDSPGLTAPWMPVAGNHDLLVQGEVPVTPTIGRIATGSRLLTGLDSGIRVPASAGELTPGLVDRVLAGGLPGPTRRVPADPARAPLGADAAVTALARAAGVRLTSGEGRLDYSFDISPRVRGIALDLVDRSGGSEGQAHAGQAAWLRRELDGAGNRVVIVFSHQPIASSRGGAALLRVLSHDPRVLATIAGHTHANSIEPRRTLAGGFWEIGTASLTDYPQQARAFEVLATEGGGVALRTWMLDTASDPLADTARELAFLDYQGGRAQQEAGDPGDRNAILFR